MEILGPSHPEQIVYFDPGCGTQNLGDEIISDSARKELDTRFRSYYKVRISTHQGMSFRFRRYINNNKYSFVLGSNLLKSNMLFGFRQWDISLMDSIQIHNCILVGCGWQTYESKRTDIYSSLLYKQLLSKDYYHSVRDEYTKTKLKELGVKNVLNTGCATLWRLGEEHCSHIRKTRGELVVTTVTDYRKDPIRDMDMISLLKKLYKKVYIWLQGDRDYSYLKNLGVLKHLGIINPNLYEYDSFLDEHPEADYVGTRLHGGIRALQHGNRTLIISVDNRAREMAHDYHIPIIERRDIALLPETVKNNIESRINIDETIINAFLNQFE